MLVGWFSTQQQSRVSKKTSELFEIQIFCYSDLENNGKELFSQRVSALQTSDYRDTHKCDRSLKLDDRGESVFSKRVENCYYQGVVNGEESSFVAVSSCNGLRIFRGDIGPRRNGFDRRIASANCSGIIAFGNGTAFGIWPLDGGDRGRRHPHER
uniref:Peptidase M12B propeptide domain-containing protein n=1 Tax=Parascaris equorum TaxID=6256 RepID=A0A914RZM9_PAREQ